MKKSLMGALFAVGLMGSLVALPAQAQQDNTGGNGGGQNNGGGGGGGGNGGGGGRQRGGGGGGGGMNFQQMQQQRMQQIKDAMGVSDDDWKAIEPKIQNVQQLQFQSQTRGFRGGRGGGGPGGPGGPGGGQAQDPGNTPVNPVTQALRDLQTTIDNKDATPEQIKSKIEAVRTAKKGAADTLKKAQDDLRELLTVKQEAVLVERGLLD